MGSSLRPARAAVSARLSAALIAAALLFASPAADAQGDKAAAESLFQTGVALMNEGKFAEACPKLVESQRADPSSGTLLNLGSCYEKIGKPASAWATYKEAAALARSLGQTEREATANGKVAALEPTLSKLRIDAGDIPGLVIKRDGLEVGRGSLGTPIAVDPGEHVIVATAPGHVEWSTKITVGGSADSKTVTVPPLQKAQEEGPAPLPPGGAPASSGRRTVGFIVGGVGVAALGLGGVFGGLAIGDTSDADPLCPGKKCNAEGQKLIESAKTKALISTIGLGVGVAAVGAGVVLILTSGASDAGAKSEEAESAAGAKPSARLIPSIGPGGGGLTLVGRF